MDVATIIGLLAGALTTCAFLPQVIKTVKTRSTKDISLVMFSVTATGLFFWLLYGILSGSVPVIIANSVSLPLALTIVAFKLKFK
jgi:MtN3 and saliva related transmembrane protein